MRISDWSSDVCSSDLLTHLVDLPRQLRDGGLQTPDQLRFRESGIGPVLARLQHHEHVRDAGWRDVGADQIGRASCRERVCKYVSISVVAVSLKKKDTVIVSDTKNINDTATKKH